MAPRLIKSVYKALFKTKTQEIPRIFLLVREKKTFERARDGKNCLIKLSY